MGKKNFVVRSHKSGTNYSRINYKWSGHVTWTETCETDKRSQIRVVMCAESDCRNSQKKMVARFQCFTWISQHHFPLWSISSTLLWCPDHPYLPHHTNDSQNFNSAAETTSFLRRSTKISLFCEQVRRKSDVIKMCEVFRDDRFDWTERLPGIPSAGRNKTERFVFLCENIPLRLFISAWPKFEYDSFCSKNQVRVLVNLERTGREDSSVVDIWASAHRVRYSWSRDPWVVQTPPPSCCSARRVDDVLFNTV